LSFLLEFETSGKNGDDVVFNAELIKFGFFPDRPALYDANDSIFAFIFLE